MTVKGIAGRLACAAVALALTGCTIGTPDDDPSPAASATTPGSVPSLPATEAPTPAAFANLDDYAAQELDWSDCGEGFECATLVAPLDYDDPAGETIEVAVNRLPSTGAAERVGSLLVNPGGPGASGLDYARSTGVVSDVVLDAFDLVGFDPRGVGSSTPVECVSDAEYDVFIAVDPTPDDADEVAALDDASREFAEACEATSGELLPHVGTVDVARDVDLLRAVLGDDQLYYLGKSYGTFIGATYADLFPDHVGRLVLDGAVDPSETGLEQGLGQAEGFEGALQAFAADCLLYADCPLTGDADSAVQQVADLLARLDAAPLPTGADRELGESLATFGVAVTLYDRDFGWPLLRQALAEAIDDGSGATLLMLSDIYFERDDTGVYGSNSNEVNAAVNCIDRGEPTTLDDVATELPQYLERAPVFGPFLAYGSLVCAHWPVDPQLSPHPVTAPGANPILVVGTTRDPATPYAAAVSLADQLESGVLLSYDGDGHTAYGLGSTCVDDAVDTYLLTGEPPADGTEC